LIVTELDKFDTQKSAVIQLLAREYPNNNIGLAKAKSWLAKMFDCFDDEIETLFAIDDELGEAIYFLDAGAETQRNISINSVLRVLETNCGAVDDSSYLLVKDVLLNMSALERKWFVRYWIRSPTNGIDEGVVKKVLAKYYDKKLSEVKKHANFNTLCNITMFYEIKEDPPCNLSHGSFVKPMLAKEVPMNKWPENKIVDYKYDGNRYQIHKQGDNVIIFNRKGSIVTPQFQDVVERVREYEVVDCIMDGEIYPIKDDGSPAEHKLMGTRVHSKDHAEAREKVKVKWVMFDCLKYDGVTVMDFPYWHRLEFIKRLPDQALRMKKGGDVLAFYNRAINDGFEGIIVKDTTLPYEAGKRSAGWAKYKPPRIELDVAITTAKYGEGTRANVFGTFGISVKSDSGFKSVGSIGTGFSDADLVWLTNELRKNVETYNNGTYNLLPRVVLEVSADLITQDAKGNYGLRFPRCKRIRHDKFVADINTIEDVESLL
jgi:DNA ligase-1